MIFQKREKKSLRRSKRKHGNYTLQIRVRGGELLEMVFSNVYCVLLGQSHLPMGGDIKGE